jgi:hypothetical protein
MQELIQIAIESPEEGNASLRYDIGDEFRGETHLRFEGNGKYVVSSTVRMGREFKEYTGEGRSKDFADLLRAMQSEGIWDTKQTKSLPGDGEPVAVIQLDVQGKHAAVRCFGTEIKDNPGFDKVQKQILGFIRDVSNNEILEIGR